MPSVLHHRRYTANHTWHVTLMRRRMFIKMNPAATEAQQEVAGHYRLRSYYPVPDLLGVHRVARWTFLAYRLWPHAGTDAGLLLDEITRADVTGDLGRLDACFTDVLDHYTAVIHRTLRGAAPADTVTKLYGDREAPGGRLDDYYGSRAPWAALASQKGRANDQFLDLEVNGRSRRLDFAGLRTSLHKRFHPKRIVWAAITQGDSTDFNIGWSPEEGPIWFDYDTGGLSSLAGEFACFLLYQRLHGAWLTPSYNPAAYRDHPSALETSIRPAPNVDIRRHHDRAISINYTHRPSPARLHLMRRYVDELVVPMSEHLRVKDLMDWLRPYLIMRLLAVYDLNLLRPRDVGLSIGLLAEALDPEIALCNLLALEPREIVSVV